MKKITKSIKEIYRLPFNLLLELREINIGIKRANKVLDNINKCTYDSNHKGRPSIRTGHWNES